MRQLFAHSHVARLATRLEHDPQPGLPVHATAMRVDAEHLCAPCGAVPVALEDLDRGALACAVRPEEGECLTASDVEADTVQCSDRSVVLAQVAHRNRGVRVGFGTVVSGHGSMMHCGAPGGLGPPVDRLRRRARQLEASPPARGGGDAPVGRPHVSPRGAGGPTRAVSGLASSPLRAADEREHGEDEDEHPEDERRQDPERTRCQGRRPVGEREPPFG